VGGMASQAAPFLVRVKKSRTTSTARNVNTALSMDENFDEYLQMLHEVVATSFVSPG
jgi:hypothetical protein